MPRWSLGRMCWIWICGTRRLIAVASADFFGSAVVESRPLSGVTALARVTVAVCCANAGVAAIAVAARRVRTDVVVRMGHLGGVGFVSSLGLSALGSRRLPGRELTAESRSDQIFGASPLSSMSKPTFTFSFTLSVPIIR